MSKNKGSLWQRINRVRTRVALAILGLWVAGIVLFAFLPVQFSAVVVERQIGAWLRGDFHYVAHSDWAGHHEISPWMALAVVASEDQKLPVHWGFDVDAIESVLSSEGERMRVASTLSQQTAKNLFLWDGRSWVRKGFEAGLTVGIETVHFDGLSQYCRVWPRDLWRRGCIAALFP